jgi:hypothetical protein
LATHIFGTSYIVTSGNAVDLADGDNVYVAAGATVGAQTFIGISSDYGSHRVDVFGNVVGGYNGVSLGDSDSHGSRLFLSAQGQIYGYENAGVLLQGYSHTFINKGYVYGDIYGVWFNAIDGNGVNVLNNAGTIESDETGVYNRQMSTDQPALQLTNTGTITAATYSYRSDNTDVLIDIIVNKGTMIGKVMLGGGADSIDTSAGKVQGQINLGDGSDGAIGSSAADNIFGGTGNDSIVGGGGGDTIEGYTGRDTMTGGTGADKFVFKLITATGNTTGTADVITDFTHSQADKINLSAIDANINAANNQAFKFIGTAAFANAGDLRYTVSGGHAYVSGDINGNGTADFMIRLNNTASLVAGDFVL